MTSCSTVPYRRRLAWQLACTEICWRSAARATPSCFAGSQPEPVSQGPAQKLAEIFASTADKKETIWAPPNQQGPSSVMALSPRVRTMAAWPTTSLPRITRAEPEQGLPDGNG